MSTPFPLLRCGMKDLISCFNGRKVLTKEDPDESVHRMPKSSSNDVDHRKREREKHVEHGTTAEKGGAGQETPASWKSCDSEEDGYIVFYFKDDDAGADVIEERCLESWSGRKQDAVGDHRRKILEIHEIQVNSKSISSKMKEVNEYEQREHLDALGDSSDSSTSSFAFPRMHSEWTGSPVLMPRPEGHKKTRSVCVLQCCKI